MGDSLTIPAPADVLSGDLVQVGDMIGVASHGAENGEDVTILTRGVFELPKKLGDVFTVGQPAYWDASVKSVTTSADSNVPIGYATTSAESADGDVLIRLR
ncbi:MAG TPA: DUF2190 family protein [Azospirillaceae bacterium]|nr:DUF2190 family protein [Azospirillaceae bacterium]